MSETPPAAESSQQQDTKSTPEKGGRILLGHPATEVRCVIPVFVFVASFVILVVFLFLLPLHRMVNAEPDPVVREILAGFWQMLHIRFWPVLLVAALLAMGMSMLLARGIERGHKLLEQRLRRVASGEPDDKPYSSEREFTQFKDVTLTMQYALDRANKRSRQAILQAESTIDRLAKRISTDDVPKVELLKAINGIVSELSAMADASRGPGGGRPKT